MLKRLFIHPLALTLYPVLALLSANVSQVLVPDTLRAFVAALLLAAIVILFFRILLRGWRNAALLASVSLALFFSYGHVYAALEGFSLGPIVLGRHAVLLPLWGLVWALSAWWLFRTEDVSEMTLVFNGASLFLLLFPLASVLSYYAQAAIIRNSQESTASAAQAGQPAAESPDVYYIVLDMHARADVLKALYGYDNTWFTEALKEKGFYIADASTSNYSSTLQSLASSLNMEYINYLEDQYGAGSDNREPLGLLLKDNKVFQLFQENGYQIGAFQSDDFYTEFRDLEYYRRPGASEVRRVQDLSALNPFEALLVRSTLLRLFYDLGLFQSQAVIEKSLETPYDLHRLTVLYALEHLPDFSRQDGPFFVFAHIVAPHPPYVFGRNGQKLSHTIPYSLSAPGRQDGGLGYVKLYADQLHYIDERVLVTVEEILARSATPPVIIIQGDHGPVSYSGEDELGKSNMWEQHAILNAYFFPGAQYNLLYPSITPVNSFRVLLNTYFGGQYELLPDKNYFLPHAHPYDFKDVTGRVKSDEISP